MTAAMVTCPNGHRSPAHQHFCGECGAPIAPAPHLPEPKSRVELWEENVCVQRALAIVALIFLVDYSVDVLARPHGWADIAVWVVGIVAWAPFAIDYLVRTILALRAHDWRRWSIRTKNLFDLLIVIPWLGPLRVVRVVVAIRALHRALGGGIRRQVIVYTVGGTLLLVYVASLLELEYERHYNPGIRTFPDALWWSITTITTVGYGDRYPVTQPGRLVAVLLMIGAIGLVGSITATLASWIVQRIAVEEVAMSEAATAADIEELGADIRQLADELRRHGTGLRGRYRQGIAVAGGSGWASGAVGALPARRAAILASMIFSARLAWAVLIRRDVSPRR
jgi:voltage-gated potassium channel